jgi:hypothetical protein
MDAAPLRLRKIDKVALNLNIKMLQIEHEDTPLCIKGVRYSTARAGCPIKRVILLLLLRERETHDLTSLSIYIHSFLAKKMRSRLFEQFYGHLLSHVCSRILGPFQHGRGIIVKFLTG